jgi:TRAP-type transport system periplasmic protein
MSSRFGRGFSLAAVLVAGLWVAEAAAQQVTLRLSHNNSAQNSRQTGAELFAKRVGELTSGQVKVQVFPDGQLGTEALSLEGMQTGTIDLGVITIWPNAIKAGVVFELPFLFRDFDHWKAVMDGKPGRTVAESAKGTGLVLLGYWVGGWRDVYGSKPITTVESFKGLKLRTLQTPAYVELFGQIGAIPTPMAWPETYLALQQKTVDAAETSLPAMLDAKHYEVAKYAATTRHAMSSTAFLVSEARWNKLTQPQRDALIKAEKEARDFQRAEYLKEDAGAIKALQEKGVSFANPDVSAIRTVAVDKVYQKVITSDLQKALLKDVQQVK